MNIDKRQQVWERERPIFEEQFIYASFLSNYIFNEKTGDYEPKKEFEADKLMYEVLNSSWVMWIRSANRKDYVLVPKEPTEKMINTGLTGYNNSCIQEIFKAMIEAAEGE